MTSVQLIGAMESHTTNQFMNTPVNLTLYKNKFGLQDHCLLLLLRARRNEKEMKVKPATSFKLLTIFIHKKKK